jgi:hypothetical protein
MVITIIIMRILIRLYYNNSINNNNNDNNDNDSNHDNYTNSNYDITY